MPATLMKKSAAELLEKETLRTQTSGIKCSHRSLNIAELDTLRISASAEAVSCHVLYLTSNPTNGWVWSGLGALFTSVQSRAQAALCFKQAAKFDGSVTKNVHLWQFIGPFPIGKMENDGDPTEAYGGVGNISKYRFQSKFSVLSELVSSGQVFWSSLRQKSSTGYFEITPNVAWSELVNSLGSTGILEWQGWAVGEISVNLAETNVLVRCLGVTSLFIDHIPVVGDVYHREQYRFSVSLPVGVHTIFVKARGKGSCAFRCDFDATSAGFEVLAPHFLPDLHDGRLFSGHISLPVANLQSTKWLRNIKIAIEDAHNDATFQVVVLKIIHAIAPGQVRFVSFEVTAENFFLPDCNEVLLSIKVSSSIGFKLKSIVLRCRKRHESFLFTFVDHDGSIQHAAAIRPSGRCRQRHCPVVLTLHGTTVPPQNQADSYKHMVDKKFVFGFQHAWLLAPTRHGAHNWEGPGALTALTSLEQLSTITSRTLWIHEHQSSPDLAVIAGHSMGGHGAWHLATNYPDKALGVISLSGWIRKEDYGDSNLFFRHDISSSQLDSETKAVLEKCVIENYADKHISNLKGAPVFIRTGANDRTVHPFFARRMHRLMSEAGINVTYSEVPDKDHWWWDTSKTNDGGCVNDDVMRSVTDTFLDTKVFDDEDQCSGSDDNCEASNGNTNLYRRDSDVNFTYSISSVGFGGTVRGLRIFSQLIPHQESSVKVEISGENAVLTTRNVNVLQVRPNSPSVRPIDWTRKQLQMDGTAIQLDTHQSAFCLCRDSDESNEVRWTLDCESCNDLDSLKLRGPMTAGPARRVAEKPFLIVSGTLGSSETTLAIERLAVYISNLFFLTSDAETSVIKDMDLTSSVADEHNLIVIGSPHENLFTQRYLSRVPIEYERGVISLNSCHYDNAQTGVLTLAPHVNQHVALVLFGNSLQGLMDVVSLAAPTIPPMTRSPFSNMVPDFIITGPNYRLHGPGGYLCTGFWGNHWDFRPELTSCSFC